MHWVSVARAEEPSVSKVVLVDSGVPALSQRLRDEIESLGFEVTRAPEREPAEPLEALARSEGAVAAIRVSESGHGAVEMTIVDRATGKTVSRRLAIATPTDPASAELIATRTVELLRASLMELAAAHPARGDVVVTPEVEALTPVLAPERVGTLSLALGPALVHTPSWGVSFDVWAALTLLTQRGIGGTAQVSVPLTSADLTSREGTVELLASLYRLGGVLDIDLRSPIGARLQAGVLLARLTVSGSADTPYFGREEHLLAWGPWIGANLQAKLGRGFSVLLGSDTALTFPRTVVRSAGREVAIWGRPVSSGAAGLELAWP